MSSPRRRLPPRHVQMDSSLRGCCNGSRTLANSSSANSAMLRGESRGGMEDQLTLALLAGELRLLEMIASGSPLGNVLETLCGLVEAIVSGSMCSILLIDPSGKFRHGAGPTLPPGYDGTVNGAPVACEAGPCDTAASWKQQVIVPDLASDPRWVGLEWRTLVLEHGLRSVCSTPIVSLTGKVLGTFAIYQREPRPPSTLLKDLIARFTHVASIAIERAISERELQERERESRVIVNSISGLVATLTPTGEVEAVNEQVLAYLWPNAGRAETVGNERHCSSRRSSSCHSAHLRLDHVGRPIRDRRTYTTFRWRLSMVPGSRAPASEFRRTYGPLVRSADRHRRS